MKKLLSVILAVAVVMSLFCVVPASAENINTWPYYFEDFEDHGNSMQSSVAATIVDGGADGSQYAGQYTVSADRDLKFITGSTSNVINTGDTFKATADIKLSKAITPTKGDFYLHYTAANNSPNFTSNGYLKIDGSYPAWSFDNTSTDWQKVSFEGVYTGLDVCLDGSFGVTFRVPGDTTGGEYSITLDNVEIQIIKTPVVSFATGNWTSTNGKSGISTGGATYYNTAPDADSLYFYAIDGSAFHTKAAHLAAGKQYDFSVFIKPCANNSSGTLEIGLNYTYKDETAANSVVITTVATRFAKFSELEYTAEFTTPANMATAELYIKQLDTVGEGQNISRFDSSSNLCYYVDDVSFEATIPVVTASATAVDGIVTVDKTFTAGAGATDASVIKLTATKNGVKSYIASTKSTIITVPEAYQTGYELGVEITPIASSYIGEVVTIDVPAAPVVVGTTFTATAADGATLTSGEAMAGTAIWAAYDANGKMLDWSSAPMSVTAGGTQTVAVPADFNATGAAEVKVMLWADMVACKPLADHVAY